MHTRRRGLAAMLAGGLILATLSIGQVAAQAAAGGTVATAVPVAAEADPGPPRGTAQDPIAHDPTIIKQGDYYYAIITGDAGVANTYLPMKRSTDLVEWEELGPVFTAPPQWIVDTLGTTPADFWAPEIAYVDGEYRLYYAASQFATNNSLIALATTPTLDPDSPDFGWTDEGLVLRSTTADVYNAIDPEVTVDQEGNHWFAWGSFWSGLWIRPLDPATGKLVEGGTATHLVDRRWAPNAVEAPAIVHHDGFYYLFASFDYCCRGANSEYRTVVGRSESITGPYVDRSGQPLLNGGGTELLRGYNEFVGPGGGDVYVDGDRTLYVHHYYDADDDYLPRLSVREVTWDAEGWPSFGDPLTGSRDVGHGPAYVQLIERTSGNAIGTVPGGDAAPLCGYEGADVRLLAASGPCTAWRLEQKEGGYAAVRNLQTNKVLDVEGCGTADGTNVLQWGWLNNDCQQFRLVPTSNGWTTLQSKVEPNGQPGKLVDAGTTCQVGDDVTISSPAADGCQEFRLQPYGNVLVVSAATGEPVAGRGVGRTAGATSGWRFEHTSEGYYRVTTERGSELPVRGCVRETVRDRDRDRTLKACDEWRLVPMDDGTFALADRLTGKVVGRMDRFDRLELQTATGAEGQRFRLVQP